MQMGVFNCLIHLKPCEAGRARETDGGGGRCHQDAAGVTGDDDSGGMISHLFLTGNTFLLAKLIFRCP